MPIYRLDIAYDGSPFHGYAAQPGQRTVQGDLEAALQRLVGEVESAVAGRTDAGVHATGQVVSLAIPHPIDVDRVRRSLNGLLGPEISVLRIVAADDGFHARFSAQARQYRYLILNREAPDPFLAATAWHVATTLDVAEMDGAAAALVGEHDFASFCRRPSGEGSTVRRVLWSRWRRDDDRVELSIAASSFCHQMVRSVVAFSVEVGRGRRAAADVPRVLGAADRAAASGAAPAHGLTLVAVGYEGSPLRPPQWVSSA